MMVLYEATIRKIQNQEEKINSNSRELEKFILNSFRGKYVNPKKINSFNPEFFEKLYNNRERLNHTPVVSPSGHARPQEQNLMNYNIGTIRPNSKFNEKGSYDMEINLPFYHPSKFWLQPPTLDPEKPAKNPPEFEIFYHTQKVGAIWKKMTNSTTPQEFLSGSVFFLGREGNNFNFSAFRILDEKLQQTESYRVTFWVPDGDLKQEDVNHEPV